MKQQRFQRLLRRRRNNCFFVKLNKKLNTGFKYRGVRNMCTCNRMRDAAAGGAAAVIEFLFYE